jgi:hypothetical protein
VIKLPDYWDYDSFLAVLNFFYTGMRGRLDSPIFFSFARRHHDIAEAHLLDLRDCV